MDTSGTDWTRAGVVGTEAEAILRRLERRITLSRLALLWERLWPALVPPISLAALFLTLAFLGVWGSLPETERLVGLAVYGLVFAVSLIPFARIVPPTRRDAVLRLDHSEGVSHRPLGALTDRLPATTDDVTRAIWQVHLERELKRAEAVRVTRPHPNVSRRDPYMLRVAAALLLVVGLVYAGPSATERLAAVFTGAPAAAPVPPRIDAWVTPPAFTGRPPVFLSTERRPEDGPLRVPQGSIVSVRVDRADGVEVMADGKAIAPETEAGNDAQSRLFHTTLEADGTVALRQAGAATREWRFAVDIIAPPTITLIGQVEQTPGGAVRVKYKVEHDYGVASAHALIERVEPAPSATPPRTLGINPKHTPRPLVEAPVFPLAFPRAHPRSATGTTTRDLTNHPWAGARVRFTLVAVDDRQQEGRSQTVLVELPQRRFDKPLARAVIEQRRNLAMDAEARQDVATALDILTIDPQKRIDDTKAYLGLRSAYYRLINARSDDDLRGVVDFLWEVALLIEDGDLSVAERALRDAQERLEQALRDGANPEEIRRLMEELRQALNQVMREMMQQALRDQREGRPQRQPGPNDRIISQRDIDRLMKEIEELMRSGNMDAARNKMAQLRDMLDALRNARPQLGQGDGQQDMLDELGNMIREQQRLMDQTFRQRQQNRQQPGQRNRQQPGQRQPGQRQPGQPGQPGQQGDQGDQGDEDQAMRDLQQGQGSLRDQLQRFMDQLRQGGQDPGRALGDAGREMNDAENQLGQGRPGDALGPQNRALDNLRRGAQQMARDMMGQGDQGPNGQPGDPRQQADGTRRPNMDDPLQRSLNEDQNSSDVRVPNQADRQRIQEILEDVRRRLADPSRPTLELDYLQRLLRPF